MARMPCIELTGGCTPDLMICDIAMPRMNGLELVEYVRNRGEQITDPGDLRHRKHGGYSQSVATWRRGRAVKAGERSSIACARPFTPVSIPAMFSSRVEEEERLFRGLGCAGQIIPSPLRRLLQELQPPVSAGDVALPYSLSTTGVGRQARSGARYRAAFGK